MTRDAMLAYIANKYKDDLAQVGLQPVDTPESLFFVINDALMQSNDAKRKSEADKRVEMLIKDRLDGLDIEQQVEPEGEVTENVSNE